MKRSLCLLLTACALACATAWQLPVASFTNTKVLDTLSYAAPACTTEAVAWHDADYLTLAWNAYGDSTTIYDVCLQWADSSLHFDVRRETILTCTLAVGYRTRSTAIRVYEQGGRPVTLFGRGLFLRSTSSNSACSVKIDSVRFIKGGQAVGRSL